MIQLSHNCKIFTDNVEDSAIEQLRNLLNIPVFSECEVRAMPDIHAGAGCVIGFTANLGDKVIPNIVGVDIGCGMLVVELGMNEIDFSLFQQVINNYVPSGRNVHESDYFGSAGREFLDEYREAKDLVNDLKCYRYLKDPKRFPLAIGSLGGGNHFIEINRSEKFNKYYLVIHTGSRNMGKQVADYYQKLAVKFHSGWSQIAEEQNRIIEQYKAEGRKSEIQLAIAELHRNYRQQHPDLPNELCYLEGQNREDYLHDMRCCQRFAQLNRQVIGKVLTYQNSINPKGLNPVYSFETVHNYIDDEGMIRKGAISCQKDERVIIPMNMRDGSLLCIGKGNPDWNYSGPHGAGRVMSRSKAKEVLDLEDYKNSMTGIYTESVSIDTIDEAPMVYKPMDEIIENIKDTAEVYDVIKPIFNFKASE